jgi:hypothetical protein
MRDGDANVVPQPLLERQRAISEPEMTGAVALEGLIQWTRIADGGARPARGAAARR